MTPEELKRIEEIYCEALELDPTERETFLDRACGDDAALRREVEMLLAETGDETAPFASLVSENAGSFAAGASLIDRRVGAYRVVGAIGRGGMAEVYRAVRDDDEYRQEVALKVVRRGMVTAAMLARFRHERQILASLDHPNIARILDGGTTDDGLPYFVMECIDGLPVTEYCHGKHLSVRQRLALFRQICAAVQHAHRNLVVHRDLKPSNILVTGEGSPKLLDFGIAKLLSPDRSPTAVTAALTAASARLMTPLYASPEQVRGEPVTTATDVYALGVVLYELLTGENPHQFKDGSMREIERVVCETEAERPSTAVARRADAPPRLRRVLAGDLDTIVLKALRKEPERRYQSVEQLSEDVRRYLEGRPVAARSDAVGYRAGKFVRRHATAVSAAALFVVLLVGFSIAASLQAARIARERDRANQVTEFLVELFEVSDPGEARGSAVTAREILDRGAERVERELADQPELQAAMMDAMGRVYRSLGLYDSARPLLERALILRRETLGRAHPDVAESVHALAVMLYYKGDYENAERLYREGLELRLEVLDEDDPRVAESYNDLGELLRATSRLDEAEDLHRRALAIRRATLGDEHEDVAYSLHNLATVLDDRQEYVPAEAFYREALEIKRKALGPGHPSVATTLNNLALLRRSLGDNEQAEALYREALEIRRRVLGVEHPELAVSLNNLAMVLRARGDLDGAEVLFREALVMKVKLLGRTHPSTAVGLQNLADVLEAKGDLAAAERTYAEALEATTAALGPNHWRLAAVQSGYGRCLKGMKRYREAERYLLEAHAGLVKTLGEENARTRQTAENLVALYEAWNRPADAARFR